MVRTSYWTQVPVGQILPLWSPLLLLLLLLPPVVLIPIVGARTSILANKDAEDPLLSDGEDIDLSMKQEVVDEVIKLIQVSLNLATVESVSGITECLMKDLVYKMHSHFEELILLVWDKPGKTRPAPCLVEVR